MEIVERGGETLNDAVKQFLANESIMGHVKRERENE